MPNYYAEGRTALRMQCPHCGAYSDHPTEKTDPSRYRWDDQATEIFKELLGEDLSFRQRTKCCKKCKRSFMTIEMSKNYLWAMINPTPPEYHKWLDDKDTLNFSPFPAYDYLSYLRHHGFPSPFIDWSASPYIAIFFAFNGCSKDEGSVSLYILLEHASVGKVRSSNQSEIYSFGPYVKAHRRHVLQQSQYTICVELDDDYKPKYANHEQVFGKDDEGQDRLWKFNIPITERIKVLKILNRMNINSFSLFGSEDALAETISTNEIIKRKL